MVLGPTAQTETTDPAPAQIRGTSATQEIQLVNSVSEGEQQSSAVIDHTKPLNQANGSRQHGAEGQWSCIFLHISELTHIGTYIKYLKAKPEYGERTYEMKETWIGKDVQIYVGNRLFWSNHDSK